MAEALSMVQRRWADHVRDPSRPAPEGIDARRLAIYRRLCIDSLDGLLAGSLPRLQQRLDTATWRATVEHYYAHHACHTPLFPQVAQEFSEWLGSQQECVLPAWAAELAHFECCQQALRIEPREPGPPVQGALALDTVLALSPQVRVLGYRWPVHDDDAAWPDMAPAEPTLLLMRRLPDFDLQLDALATLAYPLLLVFGDDGCTIADALQALADAHGVAKGELLLACAPLLDTLCAQGVLLPAIASLP
ncbi:putative DNA-binding domain-containing protein [Stenotrophomonas sp. 24(2023)]|uniref:HvfC family RiPP maturation protein n=1 Tax=Stenotrophomonas sp. 24(2023) TaxID=3068324 RepID=UPI0027DF3FA1|nr:putative DNA-binding domain-containing protein [Stenotrophomonas sp. 24(2023)]WMJ68255.1 putative DNA-binding domain-containing protein [Stenotrophomonas sp. 24(2023)]